MALEELLASEALAQPGAGARLRRRVFGHTTLMIGATVLALVTLAAVFAPLLAPHDPFAQDLAQRLIPPVWHDAGSWDHPLGTDQLGRDYLSRLLFGARISLVIGTTAMAMSATIGVLLGLCAGYFGHRVDLAIG